MTHQPRSIVVSIASIACTTLSDKEIGVRMMQAATPRKMHSFLAYDTGRWCGTGKRLADGKSVETNFTYFCPIRNRRVPVRQVITHDSDARQTHRMWASDMATDAEYLMMEATYTRLK